MLSTKIAGCLILFIQLAQMDRRPDGHPLSHNDLIGDDDLHARLGLDVSVPGISSSF